MKSILSRSLVLALCLFLSLSVAAGASSSSAKDNNPVLQEDKLKDISKKLMEVLRPDFFIANKIPVLPNDITDKIITDYYLQCFADAYYEEEGSFCVGKDIKVNKDTDQFVVSKKIVDEIGILFGKPNIDLKKYLHRIFSIASYDETTQSYIINSGGIGDSTDPNRPTFDYTVNGVEIHGDTAIVSCNTYYTDDYNKFWEHADGLQKMPDWGFKVKPGVYKIQYKAVNGNVILSKSEYLPQPSFKFVIQ